MKEGVDEERPEAIPRRAWIILGILGSVGLVTTYGETMIIPAIPDLIHEFDISYSLSSWILTSYLIAGAVMTPIAGKLSDIYGRKKVLLILMVIYTIGLSFGGLSSNFTILILARIIQGIGISMFSIAFSMILDEFPKRRLATAQGIIAAVFSGGAVIGLAVGGTIIEAFDWRATFLSVVPLSIIIIIIISKLIHDEKSIPVGAPTLPNIDGISKSYSAIDLKGALALTSTITSFLLAITFLESIKQSLYLITFLSIISLASLFCFILIERKSLSPLIDLKLLKDRIILPANILLMCLGCTLFMTYQTIAIMIKSPTPFGFGGNSINIIQVQLPFMLILFLVAIISGFLISKLGNVKPTIIGSVISSIGFFSLFLFHLSELSITINLIIIAIGISFTEVGAFNISTLFVPKQFSGISIGITTLLFLVGMSIGPAISGMFMEQYRIIVDAVVGSYPSGEAYNLIFLTSALISIVAVALTLVVTRRVSISSSIFVER
ncbi:MAG: MFS transporter [Nitrososphaerota archaeon]